MPLGLPDDLVPITEAAEKVGRPVVTVRNWVRSHKVRGYRRGGKLIYVSMREVEAYEAPKPIDVEESAQDSADVR